MKSLSYDCMDLFERNGFKFYKKHYSINIFGIRKDKPVLNKFDDYLFITFNDYNMRCSYTYRFNATTVPGDDFLGGNMLNKNGTFILLPSTTEFGRQYKFKTGVMHHGKYECLGEKTPTIGYRDKDMDGELDLDYDDESKLYEDTNGTIHIHHAGKSSTLVDRWSAGCQVIANLADWNTFWDYVKKSENHYGSTFTYTLFQESDLTDEEKTRLLV